MITYPTEINGTILKIQVSLGLWLTQSFVKNSKGRSPNGIENGIKEHSGDPGGIAIEVRRCFE